MMNLVLLSLIGNIITLYMLVVLLYWTAPWLELNLHQGYWRLIPRAASPLVNSIRKVLPSMGPMDWSPLAAVMALWLLRLLLVQY